MQRYLFMVAAVAINAILSTQTFASSFRAMPLKIYLDNNSKTEVLKIVNEGDERVTVQVSTKTWSQDVSGKDEYGDTNDIVVFPKMATIEAHDTRVFRVGYTGSQVSKERSYRLFAQELPVAKPGEAVLKFALNLSLPVFMAPDQSREEWAAQIEGLAHETLQVKVNNIGTKHILVNKIKAIGMDARGAEIFNQGISGWYTLGGNSRIYNIPVAYQQCMKAAQVNVEVETKSEKKQLQMPVSKSMCSKKP